MLIFILLSISWIKENKPKILRVPAIENVNHEVLCYCFVTKEITQDNHFKLIIDTIANSSKFTTVFLCGRNDADIYDYKTMHPFFKEFVAYAHQRKLKVGLQLWNSNRQVDIENTTRCIVEGEIVLDRNGSGVYTGKSRNIRYTEIYPINVGSIIQSELFKVYAFTKTSDGFYDPASLEEITSKCTSRPIDKETVEVTIYGGQPLQGKTAYIMTQHYYNFPDNHSQAAIEYFEEALNKYADIPFDGFALDEYGNMRIYPPNLIEGRNWRDRLYSLPMAKDFNQKHNTSLERTLFDMRYVPKGDSSVRMKAINNYMVSMREGPLKVERAVCEKAKEIFERISLSGFTTRTIIIYNTMKFGLPDVTGGRFPVNMDKQTKIHKNRPSLELVWPNPKTPYTICITAAMLTTLQPKPLTIFAMESARIISLTTTGGYGEKIL